MHLGLLGHDRRVGWLLDAARAAGHALGPVCDVDPSLAAALGGGRTAPWDALLDPAACDAVLVGTDGWHGGRADAVRALVQEGRTLVVSHPPELSMVWAYELDMIRQDTGAVLIPFLPDRRHPLVGRLRALLEAALAGAGEIGTPETLLFERRLAARGRDAVLRAFARDADLIRAIAGGPRRLTTLGGGDGGPGPDDGLWTNIAIGLSGPASLPVRWQASRGAPEGLTIRLVGSAGEHLLEIPDGAAADCRLDGGAARSLDRGAVMLADVERAVAARTATSPPGHDTADTAADGATIAAATWDDAARAIELAETVPRSLVRGRAIDLHQEEYTDLGTFKGMMASVGCGLVLLGLLVVIVATLLAGIARAAGWDLLERVVAVWPAALLAILGAFLALQVIPLLVGSDDGRTPRGPDSPRRRDP